LKFRLQGIADLSTIDWPGKLAAVIFLQGCNLRCPWCQNVDGIDLREGKEESTERIIGHLEGLKPIVDSVVLTGGEPLLQPEVCLELSKAAKGLGFSCAVETNATNPTALKKLLPHLDLVAVDVKAPPSDPQLYDKVTGSTGMPELALKVRECLELAMHSDAEVEARTTLVPTLNDSEDIVARIAREVKGVDRLRLQQFRNLRTLDPSFQKLPAPSRGKLLGLAKVAKRSVENVGIFTAEGGLESV